MGDELTAPICEIFESIQGEGRNVGKPVIFIRFYGCNLRCRFNGKACDTPYAVLKKGSEVKDYTPTKLVKKLKTLKPIHIVWTGGEPLLYQDFIIKVMKKLMYYIGEVETNGTIKPKKELFDAISIFNISVKLKSSNQANTKYENIRINKQALEEFNNWNVMKCFKFVVANPNDIKEILYLKNTYSSIPIYLMPEGETREQVIKNSEMTVDLCLKHGFRFSPREHIIIWNKKRGI